MQPLLARFGATAYEIMMHVNRSVICAGARGGLPHWSFAAYLKLRLANAVRYVEAFEHAAAQAALSRNLDGIVCGHFTVPDFGK